mgnify:CR=1 FL=1
MKKQINLWPLVIMTVLLCVGLAGCGDSDSEYITSIKNNTTYDVIARFIPNDSIIVCQPNQEKIIEKFWGGSVKK